MLELALYYIELFDDLFWGYLGVPALVIMGVFLTFKSGFFQIIKFPAIAKTFFGFLDSHFLT